jgi:hypothetical protein
MINIGYRQAIVKLLHEELSVADEFIRDTGQNVELCGGVSLISLKRSNAHAINRISVLAC